MKFCAVAPGLIRPARRSHGASTSAANDAWQNRISLSGKDGTQLVTANICQLEAQPANWLVKDEQFTTWSDVESPNQKYHLKATSITCFRRCNDNCNSQ